MKPELQRSLRTPAIFLLGVNGVVGGGIFLLPGQVAKYAGANAVWAVLTAGALCLLIGLAYSEAGSMFNETGGSYVYARQGLGKTAGFSVGWMAWINYVVGWAVLSNGLAVYADTLIPAVKPFRSVLIVLVVGGLAWLNTHGAKKGALSLQVLTVAKFMPLILLVVYGVFFVSAPAGLSAVTVPHANFLKAVLLLVFAYGGFEMAAVPAGEMVNPRKTVAVAIIGTLVGVTLFYMLIQYAALRIDPQLATANAPLATVGRLMFAGGLTFMTIGALLSILGTKSGVALSSPRSLYALARDEVLPGWLATVHPVYKTPVAAIWTTAVFAMALALSHSFSSLILLNVVARLYEYLMVCVSVVALRYRKRSRGLTGMRVPIAIPSTAALLCTVLLTNESVHQLLTAAACLFVGMGFYVLQRYRQRKTEELRYP
ncbi:APC family permease [Alicyclobacillus sp. SO9]|uniref:APC family permease n=1 Tax=Alicyclobacillus sp. SO9 TaxID=2665646 RepID=UPI0018E85D54|nr:APC family permease [Alicyclobacillus sp. SO9]QQE77167.1 amino acid permease [Alicyclobacillus sp. SO9]